MHTPRRALAAALVPLALLSCGVDSTLRTAEPARADSPLHRAALAHQVPVELLAAIGWTQSRFVAGEPDAHDGHALRFGVAQLTDAQVKSGAALAGLTEPEVRTSLEANLMATAALLRAEVPAAEASWEAWLDAAARLLAPDDDQARSGIRHELLTVLADGVDVAPLQLSIAAVPGLLPDTADELESASFELTAPGQYPPLEWYPASAANQLQGRGGGSVKYVLVHVTEGSYWSTLSWFGQANPYSASTQYVIRSSDGHIAQMVSEANTAWHAGNDFYSRNSIGIEHEGFAANPQAWFTEAMYRSSAQLVCAIARRYGIPVDRQHIIGHHQVPNSRVGFSAPPATDAQFAADRFSYGGVSNHFDPGTGWRWDYYLSLIRACVGGGATQPTTPSSPITCSGSACWATGELRYGDTGAAVFLLQQALVYLGQLAPATMLTGPGTFGPATQAALRSFQSSHGVAVTGVYSAPTLTPLRAALLANPPSVPAANLSYGVTSSSVSALQAKLTAAGYPLPTTGYFGPMTRDAVLRFQLARGVPGGDGSYGPLTRMALAARLARGR
ncbi:MAG: hypothetical protein AMXMBFR34_45130 [Myxococcaceae bacterium]